jgi:hypothetical protein
MVSSPCLVSSVDEDGDIGLAALGGGLVEADRLQPAEVHALERLRHVVLDDAPQALVGDADDAGGGQHRHLAHQHERGLLEQKREPAALARPRHLDAQHAVLGALGARHLGGDVAVMLEEVEVPPVRGLAAAGLP